MLPSTSAMFGEWRERLQGRPDRASWARLCELLLEAWLIAPHAVIEQWLPYAHAYLGRWPEKTRYTPFWAIEFMLEADASRLLELTGCLELEGLKSYDLLRMNEHTAQLSIASLSLKDEVFSEWSASLLSSDERLADLERLSLKRTEYDAKAFERIGDSIWLDKLEHLELDCLAHSKRSRTPRGLFQQLDLRSLRSLAVQDVAANYFSSYEYMPEDFVQNRSYDSLQSADLWHLTISEQNAHVMTQGAFGAHLQRLYLYQAGWNPDAMETFASDNPESFPRLKHLYLERCELAAYRVKALCNSPWFKRLEHVQLTQCGLSDDRYEMILDAAREMPALRRLELDLNFISDDHVIALSNHDALSKLEVLELSKRWGRRSPAVYNALATSSTLSEPLRQDYAKRFQDALAAL